MPLRSLTLLLSSARDHNIKWQAVEKEKENNELTMQLCHASYLIWHHWKMTGQKQGYFQFLLKAYCLSSSPSVSAITCSAFSQ